MRQGTANLNRMIRKNSQIKDLSEQLEEGRQGVTGTSGEAIFSRINSDDRESAEVEKGAYPPTAGDPAGPTRVTLARRHGQQLLPRATDGSAPGKEGRQPTEAQTQISEWTACAATEVPERIPPRPGWEGRSRRLSRS